MTTELITKIKDFCSQNNCTPEDLMDVYLNGMKKQKPVKSETKDSQPKSNNTFFNDYRKKKLGL